jgi:hypothetical protein
MYNDIQVIKKYKFKANTAFTIIKNAKVLKNAIELFDEARRNLLETYAEKDEAGNAKIENGNYVISDKEEFAKEFISLQNAEQDIDFSKIKLSDISEIEIEAELMETMSEFIEE